MSKNYQCIKCGNIFERTRPDQNSQKMCSVKCRWENYTQISSDPESCWEWIGTKIKNGYGVLRVNKKLIYAHRISLQLIGVDIDKSFVLHSCDNPSCVNPNHLRPGTPMENVQDTMIRKRHAYQNWSDEEKKVWLNKILHGQKQSKLRQIFV